MTEKSSTKELDRLLFKPVPKNDPIEIKDDPETLVGKKNPKGCLKRLLCWVQQSNDEPSREFYTFFTKCCKTFKMLLIIFRRIVVEKFQLRLLLLLTNM